MGEVIFLQRDVRPLGHSVRRAEPDSLTDNPRLFGEKFARPGTLEASAEALRECYLPCLVGAEPSADFRHLTRCEAVKRQMFHP